MKRNTADPPSFVNTLFRAMALNTGAIYEEMSKLTVERTASFVANTNPDIAPPIFRSKLWRYIEGGAILGGRGEEIGELGLDCMLRP
jgi:hypothetical protein